MKLQPINGRILVKPLEVKSKTLGGIYFPDTAQEKLHEGKIIAVADDATDEVAVGDHIIYRELTGTEVKIEGQEYILFIEDDLLAKYKAVDKILE